MLDPTRRFSSRVENYIKYRPIYPSDVLETLRTDCGLTSASVIGDIGSGTGILSALFLQNGNRVFAVEPNREMREAAERLLGDDPNFISIDGRAEATTLPDASIDLLTAGQAFHWFDIAPTRAEFRRVLRPEGTVMLVWNEFASDRTPFLAGYEALLRQYAAEYERVHERRVDQRAVTEFFGEGNYTSRSFLHRQGFDHDGVQGRMLSSSYAPEVGHPNHAPMTASLSALFHEYQTGGQVEFVYRTTMYYGSLR